MPGGAPGGFSWHTRALPGDPGGRYAHEAPPVTGGGCGEDHTSTRLLSKRDPSEISTEPRISPDRVLRPRLPTTSRSATVWSPGSVAGARVRDARDATATRPRRPSVLFRSRALLTMAARDKGRNHDLRHGRPHLARGPERRYGEGRGARASMATASSWEFTPSLARMARIWVRVVVMETTDRAAITAAR